MGKIISFRLGVIIFALLIFAYFLFTYRLEDVPPGINGDEVVIGINAAEIARNGHDSEGRFLPLFTKAPGSIDWKQPVTLYAEVLVFKIFGVTYFNLRLVSVIFVIISVFLIFLLINDLAGTKGAILGSLVFMTMPIVMIQSHLALENIAPVPFIILWLLMLLNYSKSRKDIYIFYGGLIFGLSIFSYLGMRLIAPVLMILTLGYIIYLRKSKNYLSTLGIFILGTLPALFILIIGKIYYPGAILGSYRPYVIENYQSFFLPYLSSFDPSFLYILGDSTPYHSTGKHGMLLLASLPVFVAGLIYIIRSKSPFLTITLISFFLMPIFFGLGSTVHRASRLLALLPAYVIIVTMGFLQISNIRGKVIKWSILGLLIIAIMLNFLDFLSDYWYQYPQRVKQDFEKPIHLLYKEFSEISKFNNLNPLIQSDLPKQSFEFFNRAYFPQGLKRWSQSEKIPAQSVILIDLPGISSKDKDKLNLVRWNESDYYFLINKENREI